MFPKQKEEMKVMLSPKIPTKRYVGTEGLFSRTEHLEGVDVSPWTLPDENAIIIADQIISRSKERIQLRIFFKCSCYWFC